MSESPRRRKPLVADRRYPRGPIKSRRKATGPKRKKTRARTKRRSLPGRVLAWLGRVLWRVLSRTTLVAALILGGFVGYQYLLLPDVEALLDGRARGSVTLQDRDGAVFAWRGDQFGGAVSASGVSPHLKHAIIASEDKRFYRHFGLSPRGIASAVRINLREGRGALSGHGGSTITQQTAKLLCLGREFDPKDWKSEAEYVRDCRRGSIQRKAKEAIYALAMELKYSKDDILSIYMNRAYFGAGAYGVEGAMQRYFAKPAVAATPQQAAMLAGLLPKPSIWAPTANLQRSQDRAATVLRLMREQDYLSAAQERSAQANPATLPQAAEQRSGGYFADWVMASGPEFFTRDTTEDVTIKTTLDQRIQAAAEAGLANIFATKVREGSKAQAAIIVMSADGAVRAMVGGRETKVLGGFNRATDAVRQTGSAFKPFVYATAMDLDFEPNDIVQDTPYCLYVPGSGEWCPRNYDREFRGPVTLTDALKQSMNVPAVKISETVGRDLVRQVASGFGIESDLSAGPALALGTSESSLLEMTGAYAGILNGGSAVAPYGLVELRVAGDAAPLMVAHSGIRERVIREAAAQKLIWMMHKVVSEGTGRRAQFGDWPIAGKTGTTQAARDAWFIGFTADYVTGVWMGYDDNTPLTGVTGGGLPADIWRDVMVRVHAGEVPKALPMPRVVQGAPSVAQTPLSPEPARDETVIESVLREIFGGSGSGSPGTQNRQDWPSGSDR